MSNEPSAPASRPAGRKRLAALVVLCTLTVSAGVAANRFTPEPGSPGDPGPVRAGNEIVSVTAQLDRSSVLQGSDGRVRVELTLRGTGQGGVATRVPTDLVVVLDRSGSMRGEPLAFAKSAIHELVAQLGDDDRFALVSYASGGGVDIALEPASDAARSRWARTVAGIAAGGGTHMASGLDLAHQLVASATRGRAPRVVLLSDGHANQGDHSLEGLRSRAARAIPHEYVLSAVGIGPGFDETVMSHVADAGTGNFYYLDDVRELAGIFANEFAAARETVAQALDVRLRPAASGVRLVSAAGYPLERGPRAVHLRPGNLFAGQERRIWLTYQVPTDLVTDVALGELTVAFTDAAGTARRVQLEALPTVACVAGEDDYYASFDPDVYRRFNASEAFGSLKERVAARMKAGDRDGALDAVEQELEVMEHEQMRALGYVLPEAAATGAELRDALSAPEAAEPAVQNQLGKELLQSGRDLRRSGSKR